MNKKLILSIALIGATMVASSTFAYQWNPGVRNTECTDSTRQTEVISMIESSDYVKFKELFGDKWIARKIDSEEKFKKRIELQNAVKSGDMTKSKAIQTELGLGTKKQDWSKSKMWSRWQNKNWQWQNKNTK